MDPFFITCTTCQSRLRVRNPSAIGQILACPKCGSMVQVDRPRDIADSQNVPKKSDTPSTDASHRSPRTFRFREDFPADEPDAVANAQSETAAQSPVADGDRPSDEALDEPLLPDGQWLSGPGQAVRQWLPIGLAAAVGLMLAIFVFSLIGGGGQPDDSELPLADRQGALQDPAENDQRSTEDDAVAQAGTDKADDDSESAAETDSAIGNNHLTEDPTEAKADQQPADDGAEPDSSDAAQESDATPQDAESAATESDGPAESDLDQPATDDGRVESADSSAAGPLDAASETPAIPQETAEVEVDEVDEVDEAAAEQVAARLSLTINAVEFQAVPLADFTQFVGDLTALPVTLDVDAMQATGIDVETELEIDLRGITIAQMLQQTLEPVGLVYQIQAEQLVVTPPRAEFETIQQRVYQVGDLADDAEQVAVLGNQVRSLIAASSWQAAGGRAALALGERVLTVDQTSLVHYRIRRFLDKLRSARGLLVRGDLPAYAVSEIPVFQRVEDQLNQPITLSLTEAVPLRHIFDRLRAETDLRVLIDWFSLAEIDWQPDKQATAGDQIDTFASWLESWLPVHGLAYRVVNEQTVQISTEGALSARPEIEVYRVADPPTLEVEIQALIERLKRAVGQQHFRTQGGPGVVMFDEPSGCLLVSLPQPQQRLAAVWMDVSGH